MSEQLSLLGSEPAPLPRMPHEPIIRSAVIEGDYRYAAKRAWGAGPCVLWNLLNPSKADGRRDDPTMCRMIRFSWRLGFGSLIVTNLYPFISASPKALRRWLGATRSGASIGPTIGAAIATERNMRIVREQLPLCVLHIAAWGNGADPDDLRRFLEEATVRHESDGETGDPAINIAPTWYCLGMTASGAPKHPLARGKHRLPDDAKLVIWKH